MASGSASPPGTLAGRTPAPRARSVRGGHQGRQDGAGELAGEAVHQHLVVEALPETQRLAATARLPEACLEVAAERRAVVSGRGEVDGVEAEDGERVVEREPRRLGAVPLAPALLLADA